ncbi:MAG: MarC family protein [Lentisphaerae bacterium]|nr:MarC family protein [Lentisphaerota bacterium]
MDIQSLIASFIAVMIKVFFLMTPFFALSMFLSYTSDYTLQRKRSTAMKTTVAVAVISLLIYWFGEYLFKVLGITIDAFRIGAGLVLMLTAIALVNGPSGSSGGKKVDGISQDITVVPLAIPTIVGPGTIGALLVMGAEGGAMINRVVISLGIIVAILLLGVVLMLAEQLERLLKRNGIQILSKVTGLMLAALSAQIIFTGIRNFLQ